METKRIILSASSLEKGQCQTIAEREPFETWTAVCYHVFLFLITK